VIENSGTSQIVPKTITITGPCTGPRIENVTSGEYIDFTSDLAVLTGESLIITPEIGTCYLQATTGTLTNVLQYLVSESIFWKLSSGNNVIRLSAATMAAGCTGSIVVQFANL
jgi:hypothetical protein